jgi:hypothetical protein
MFGAHATKHLCYGGYAHRCIQYGTTNGLRILLLIFSGARISHETSEPRGADFYRYESLLLDRDRGKSTHISVISQKQKQTYLVFLQQRNIFVLATLPYLLRIIH